MHQQACAPVRHTAKPVPICCWGRCLAVLMQPCSPGHTRKQLCGQSNCLFKRFWHASVIPSRKDPFSSDQGSQTGLGLTSTRLSDRPGTSSADVFALLPHLCYQGQACTPHVAKDKLAICKGFALALVACNKHCGCTLPEQQESDHASWQAWPHSKHLDT